MSSSVRRRRPASLALRVTTFVGLATTVMFLLSAWGIEVSIERHFAEQDLGELRAVSQSVEAALADASANRSALEHRLAGAVAGHHGVYFLVQDSQGKMLYETATPGLARFAGSMDPVTRLDAQALRIWTVNQRTYRGAVLRDGPFTVLVAMDMDFHLHYLAELQRALWLGTLMASIISVLVAWLAVRYGHAPIRRISARMQDITSEHLDVRLDPEQVPIELAELVVAFNTMLRRIEDSFQRLTNASADIAHELRTPVTNLITQTQVALSKVRGIDAYREILYSNLEEFERLSTMIGDMLFLAQADHSRIRLVSGGVDLPAEVRALFDYFEAWADDHHVGLVLEGEAVTASGDRQMLQRALSNLISNAIRHTPSGQAVVVALRQDADRAIVDVSNPGPDIPAEHLPRLFDRFYRVDPARQRKGEGAGLGLAIVKSIVEAHGGSVLVTSERGRTRFSMTLPKYPVENSSGFLGRPTS